MFVNFDYYLKLNRYLEFEMEIFNWIKSRIELLNKRTDIKWKIFSAHRPFSCSDPNADDCKVNLFALRKIEDLLAKSGF